MSIRTKLVVMMKMTREVSLSFRPKVPLRILGIKPLTLRKDTSLISNRQMLEAQVVMRSSTSHQSNRRKRKSLRARGREKLKKRRLLAV